MIHGGDIYRNQVQYDFSVNVNPYGIPERVKQALSEAVEHCMEYPDPSQEALRKKLSEYFQVPAEQIVPGNGASELFPAILRGLNCRRVLIPVPSFLGYEVAGKSCHAEIVYEKLEEENSFLLTEHILEKVREGEVLFLANPNNPTGRILDQHSLQKILETCLQRKVTVILDESFLSFTDEISAVEKLSDFPNLIVVRAFTKSFAIPGVRLGVLLCSDRTKLQRIREQLPEWNISTFAMAAGNACLLETEYLKKCREKVQKERKRMTEAILATGKIKVFPSDANFLLLKTELPLYEELLKKKILIRDCSNFQGLKKGFYRIAVRTEYENEMLIHAIREIIEEENGT